MYPWISSRHPRRVLVRSITELRASTAYAALRQVHARRSRRLGMLGQTRPRRRFRPRVVTVSRLLAATGRCGSALSVAMARSSIQQSLVLVGRQGGGPVHQVPHGITESGD
jgi:hypothetical protein